jgi:2C-methyl-D-erythritol 2,4-cyclodiphosphate synthase
MMCITKDKLFGASLWVPFMLCTSITNAIPEDIGINDRMEVIENLLKEQAMQLKEQNLKVRNLENTVRIQQDKIGELESKQHESAIEISTLKEIVMRLTAGNTERDYVKGGNITKTVKEISPKKINEQESFLEKGIYINTFKIL